MIVNMPPEMVVRFRLLGYSTKTLKKWDARFGLAPVKDWWSWLEMLEREPRMLRESLALYARKDKDPE